MADNFISKVSSAEFDTALQGGLKFAKGEWVSEEQKEALRGPAGKTPKKYVDYWTPQDQQSMVNDVLAALPTWNGGEY